MARLRTMWRLIRQGYARRDLVNILQYGYHAAPRSFETIWLDPARVTRWVKTGFKRNQSGMVIAGDWDQQTVDFMSHDKVRAFFQHFEDGVPWEETGIYDLMLRRIEINGVYDECRTLDDVKARYDGIDKLYDTVRKDGRLLTQQELNPGNIREKGGIHIHISRTGAPLFAGGGFHRLALAKLLQLKTIPVQLGVVHPDAVAEQVIHRLRSQVHTRSSTKGS